jgi:inhibitor of cysteine peptidase
MNSVNPNENKPREGSPEKQVSVEISFEDLAKDKHLNRVANVHVGDTIILTLGSNPTTGFTWPDIVKISNEEILKQTDHKFIRLRQLQNIGASGKDIWTFKANKKGTTKISLDYSRPWEGGEKREWTLNATINIE